MKPWQKELTAAKEAAYKAGAVLQHHQGQLKDLREKTPGNLVSEADTLAEEAVISLLKERFPDYAFLAEESGQQGSGVYTWAIDPLDGTTNYAHRYPFYAVSIALLVDGEPMVGVIYDPTRDELFSAVTGAGAFLNGEQITVSTTATLAQSILVTGFAYDRRDVADNNYREFCRLTHLTQGVRRDGAAALDLAYVACGRFDGYWERGLSVWDIAAGIVLVQEAGGTVTAYDEQPVVLSSGRLLATNGQIHTPLSRVLEDVKGDYITP